MAKETYRVVVAGPGHIGGAVLRELLARSEFRVVGVKAYSEDKHGVDVGTLAGLDPIGVTASTRREDVLALDADCVVFHPATVECRR